MHLFAGIDIYLYFVQMFLVEQFVGVVLKYLIWLSVSASWGPRK